MAMRLSMGSVRLLKNVQMRVAVAKQSGGQIEVRSNVSDILVTIEKSVRQRGLLKTIGRCLVEPVYQFRDWRFDSRFHVRTSGIVTVPELDISETDRQNAEKYQPVRLHGFAEVMQNLVLRFEQFTFVDFGSGKGRALLLASEFPFQRIVGVEISPTLFRIAAQNLQAYKSSTQRCKKVEVLCQNATNYSMPPEPTVFYLYNPFREDVMKAILANLRDSLVSHPRPVFLVLYNPALDYIVGQAQFLKLSKTNGRYSIYAGVNNEATSSLRQSAAEIA